MGDSTWELFEQLEGDESLPQMSDPKPKESCKCLEDWTEYHDIQSILLFILFSTTSGRQ